jgi:hypothetical protein
VLCSESVSAPCHLKHDCKHKCPRGGQAGPTLGAVCRGRELKTRLDSRPGIATSSGVVGLSAYERAFSMPADHASGVGRMLPAAVGRAVTSNVSWSAVAASVFSVVKVPRFMSRDRLSASGTGHHSGLDECFVRLTQRSVLLTVTTLRTGGQTPPVPATTMFTTTAAICGQPAGGTGLAVDTNARLGEGHRWPALHSGHRS